MRFFEEIANRESRNENEIVLYPEGLFYKAYDRSAFACVNRIPTFKPSKKRIKYCAREVASIGFPAAALAKYFPTAPRPLPDGRVVIVLKDRIDADACRTWKSSLPLRERRPRGTSKAYIATLGRSRTGNLFVHPADLLPDAPVAIMTGTTGAEQPELTTGGRGAVAGPEALNAGVPELLSEERSRLLRELRTGDPEQRNGSDRPELTTGGRGAVDGSCGTGDGARSGERLRRSSEAGSEASERRRPEWLRKLACKVLGISDIGQIEAAGSQPAAADRSDRAGLSAEPRLSGPAELPGPQSPQSSECRLRPGDRESLRKVPAGRSETREERVARLIREFRLEASTPVECVLFVADLKKEIDGYL
ncbi:MAG: hypothetical protein NC209_01565 [Alistipes sp.]|nr:hypothetical protein [Alistipes senegalensis]MCM1249818.1 hypothetical protein [Alistipes sp.]